MRIKHIADGDVGCPCQAAIRAPGIKKLGIDVVPTVARIVPDDIDASIRRDCKRAKPVPIVLRVGIVVDPNRRAKGLAIVSAAREHDIGCASSGGQHAGKHIDVVVCRAAGTVDCDKSLPTKAYSIDATLNEVATQVH